MVTVQSFERNYGIQVNYDFATHANRIIEICKGDLEKIKTEFPDLAKTNCRCNGFLEEVKTYASISSLGEMPLPEFGDELSRSQEYANALNFEWGGDRFHLCLWYTTNPNASNSDYTQWALEGKHSLTNPHGYPYRDYETFDLTTTKIARKFGQGDRFGISIEDVGFGYPQAWPVDVICVRGVYTLQIVTVEPSPQPVIIYVGGATSSASAPAVPPEITLVLPSGYTGDVFASDEITLTFNITKLTPNTAFTFQRLKAGTVVKQDSFTSDASGNFTVTFNSREFVGGSYGDGSYTFKVTQGSLGGETNAITVKVPRVEISPTSFDVNSGTSFYVYYFNYKGGTVVSRQWLKNNVNVGTATNYTMPTPNSSGRSTQNLANSDFKNSPFGAGNYKIQVTKGQIVTISNEVVVTDQPYSGGTLG